MDGALQHIAKLHTWVTSDRTNASVFTGRNSKWFTNKVSTAANIVHHQNKTKVTCSLWRGIQENCDWMSCLICIPATTGCCPLSSGCWETPPGFRTDRPRLTHDNTVSVHISAADIRDIKSLMNVMITSHSPDTSVKSCCSCKVCNKGDRF